VQCARPNSLRRRTSTPVGPVRHGRHKRCACGQPAGPRSATRTALRLPAGPPSGRTPSTTGQRTSSPVRSAERTARLSSAVARPVLANAPTADAAAPRCNCPRRARARSAIADEMLCSRQSGARRDLNQLELAVARPASGGLGIHQAPPPNSAVVLGLTPSNGRVLRVRSMAHGERYRCFFGGSPQRPQCEPALWKKTPTSGASFGDQTRSGRTARGSSSPRALLRPLRPRPRRHRAASPRPAASRGSPGLGPSPRSGHLTGSGQLRRPAPIITGSPMPNAPGRRRETMSEPRAQRAGAHVPSRDADRPGAIRSALARWKPR